MTSEHPIDSKNWYDVYEKANERETELPLITVQELASLQSGGQAGKDFLVIDVRRADCSNMIPGAVNFPAQSLHVSLESLTVALSHIPFFIFHCSKSVGRGPRAARWFVEALRKQERDGSFGREKRVAILQGGILRWEEVYGSGSLKARGQANGLKSIQL